MEPSDVMSLFKQTTNICLKNDPYSEWYYHIKVSEKEQGATLDSSRISPFLSTHQKSAIRQENLNKSIMAKKRGLSADEKKQKILDAMLAGVSYR